MSTPSRKSSGRDASAPDSRRVSQASSSTPSRPSDQANAPSQHMVLSRRGTNAGASNPNTTPTSGDRASGSSSRRVSQAYQSTPPPPHQSTRTPSQQMVVSRQGSQASHSRATSVALRSSAGREGTPTGHGPYGQDPAYGAPSNAMQLAPAGRRTPGAERPESRRLPSGGSGAGDAGLSLGSAVLNAGSITGPEHTSRRRGNTPGHSAAPSTVSRQPRAHQFSTPTRMSEHDLARRIENLELGQATLSREQSRQQSEATDRFRRLERDNSAHNVSTADLARRQEITDNRLTIMDERSQRLERIAEQNVQILGQDNARLRYHDEVLGSPAFSQHPQLRLPGSGIPGQGAGMRGPQPAYAQSPGSQSYPVNSPTGGVPLPSPEYRGYGASQAQGFQTSPPEQGGSGWASGAPNPSYGARRGSHNLPQRTPLRISTGAAAPSGPPGYAQTPSRAPRGGASSVSQREGPQFTQHGGSPGASGQPPNQQKSIKDAMILQNDMTEKLATRFFVKAIDRTSKAQPTLYLIHLMQSHIGSSQHSDEIINHSPAYQRVVVLGTLNRQILTNILEKPLLEDFSSPHSHAFAAAREAEITTRLTPTSTPRARSESAQTRAHLAERIKTSPGFWNWLDMLSQSRAEELERIFAPVTETQNRGDYFRSELLRLVKGYLRLKVRLEETPTRFEPFTYRLGVDIEPAVMVYRNPTVDVARFDLRAFASVALSTTKAGWREVAFGLGEAGEGQEEVRLLIKAEVLMGPKNRFGIASGR
ncbi:hypothetical protein MBLNU230_g7519t1 [Neophaeotheca triangularis]